jgi:hypothetical protein
MQGRNTTRKHGAQAGIALLISIFILLLISVVAIALIVASGTESAMAGNYRTATGVYYAALAGLEEARGRLLSRNPTSFKNVAPALVATVPLPVGSPFYIVNPVAGENVTPWVPGSNYVDNEFSGEFTTSGFAVIPNPSPSTNSVSTVAGIQGPSFKWVRINSVSEMSLNLDVDNDGNRDKTTPIYYDSLNSKLNTTSTGYQVFEITSFALLANGSQKLLQYLVAPVPINFPVAPGQLPALTIAGSTTNGVVFSAPTSSGYYVSGVDLTTVPFCTPGPSVPAIGVFDTTDKNTVTAGIPLANQPNYAGREAAPDVWNVSVPFATLQTPSQFDALAQSIAQNADVTIPSGPVTYPLPTVTGSTLSTQTAGMTSSNPMTVVINGNLDLNGWRYTGYGLLLVIGNLNYDPDASWQGMVLVIGQGTVTGSKTGSGGEFDGAFLVAKTRDASGNLLPDPNLGTASVNFAPGMGGVGMRYSSCWIQRAMPSANYKILSFHEISQ